MGAIGMVQRARGHTRLAILCHANAYNVSFVSSFINHQHVLPRVHCRHHGPLCWYVLRSLQVPEAPMGSALADTSALARNAGCNMLRIY